MAESPTSQVEVCIICGDRGFSNALIDCSECCETLAHQYCLGIPPGTIDDNLNWICEFCCPQKESELYSSMKSVGASTKGKRKNREQRPCIPQSEKPLTLGSKCKRIMKEETEEDQSLSSSTTTAAIGKSSNDEDDINNFLVEYKMDCSSSCMVYSDDSTDEMPLDYGESSIIPDEEQPEPLLTLLPNSLLMEKPQEIMMGTVLLVSPSGEVFIREESDFCAEDMFLFEPTPDSSFPTFGKMVDEFGQIGEKCSIMETDKLDVPHSKSKDVGEGQEEIEGLEGEAGESSEEQTEKL